MKKMFVLILAFGMTLSLAACGGGDKPATATTAATTAAPPATSVASAAPESSKAASTDNLENAEFSPEQQAAAQKFIDLAARYDGVADKVNADPNLAELGEVVDLMNEVGQSMIDADEAFADPAALTDDVLADLDTAMADTGLFLDEIESMLANYGGKQVVTVQVEIVNDTGADLHTLAMSPSNDESWGGNLLDEPLLAGESGTTEMTFTEDTLVWDLLAADSEGTTLTFAGLDFTEAPMEGAKLSLSATEGGEYMAVFQ